MMSGPKPAGQVNLRLLSAKPPLAVESICLPQLRLGDHIGPGPIRWITETVKGSRRLASVFFSYSHKDQTLRDELEAHLSQLQNEGLIESWHDRRIVAGDEVDPGISSELEQAEIILLLVSSDFLASRYCYGIEMKRAMERHEAKSARVIPVILRPCDWHTAPFGKLKAVPKDGLAVTKWPSRDEAFLDVAKEIRRAVPATGAKQISQPTRVAPQPTPSPAQSSSPSALKPRSSNMRIRQHFTEADKDKFLDDAFEFIANFFEGSLTELSARNPGVEGRFQRLDSRRFSAVVYRGGKKMARCQIGLRVNAMGGITYSPDENDNTLSGRISVEAGDQSLHLRQTLGMWSSEKDNPLTFEGAAESLWAMLIEPLQR